MILFSLPLVSRRARDLQLVVVHFEHFNAIQCIQTLNRIDSLSSKLEANGKRANSVSSTFCHCDSP